MTTANNMHALGSGQGEAFGVGAVFALLKGATGEFTDAAGRFDKISYGDSIGVNFRTPAPAPSAQVTPAATTLVNNKAKNKWDNVLGVRTAPSGPLDGA